MAQAVRLGSEVGEFPAQYPVMCEETPELTVAGVRSTGSRGTAATRSGARRSA